MVAPHGKKARPARRLDPPFVVIFVGRKIPPKNPGESVLATVAEHYANLLAPVYVWMAGGLEAALAQGEIDVAPFAGPAVTGRLAVDLGAGFGMHAVPLARRGYSVIAVDASAYCSPR